MVEEIYGMVSALQTKLNEAKTSITQSIEQLIALQEDLRNPSNQGEENDREKKLEFYRAVIEGYRKIYSIDQPDEQKFDAQKQRILIELEYVNLAKDQDMNEYKNSLIEAGGVQTIANLEQTIKEKTSTEKL